MGGGGGAKLNRTVQSGCIRKALVWVPVGRMHPQRMAGIIDEGTTHEQNESGVLVIGVRGHACLPVPVQRSAGGGAVEGGVRVLFEGAAGGALAAVLWLEVVLLASQPLVLRQFGHGVVLRV